MRGIKVRRRKDSGSWMAAVWCGGVCYRKTYATEEAAKAWATRTYNDAACGREIVSDSRILLRTFAPVFMRKYSTNKRDHISVKPLVRLLGHMRVGNITEWHCKKYIASRKSEYVRFTKKADGSPASKQPRLVGAKTIVHELQCLRHMLNVAVEHRIVGKVSLIPWRKLMLPTQHRKRVYTDEELTRMRAHLDPWLLVMVDFALETGMRGGDLCELRSGNLDMQSKLLTYTQRKTGTTITLPLTDRACEIVYACSDNLARTGYLFNNSVGRPVKKLDRMFLKASKLAVVPDARFHDLKHTFVTNARKRGVPLAVMQSIVGNSPKTMGVYTNIGVDDQRAALRLATMNQHSTSTAKSNSDEDA